MYEGGIANMNYSISVNAEFGGDMTSAKEISEESDKAVKDCLHNIQTGKYAKKSILECMFNYPEMTDLHRLTANSDIEKVGGNFAP